jgi:DNA topoisomerase IB
VCRKAYVHPKVLKCYEAGITLDAFQPRKARRICRFETGHTPEEKALLKLFQTNGKELPALAKTYSQKEIEPKARKKSA